MTSLACTTGTPIADGATVTGPGRLLNDACVRVCTVTTTDTNGTGYGFEFGASCVIPGTMAATKGLACQVGVAEPTGPPITLNPNPPAGQVKKPAGMLTRGFFVTGGRLYDKFGNDFVPRGLNNPDIWFDISDQYLAYNALDNIAAYGANTVRIVWETAAPGTPALLRRIIRRVVELRMVPMIELHDVTGGTSNQDLLTMAAYYTSAPVKQVLLDFEEFLLINIANEWSGNDFVGGYQAAVAQLRAAGLNHTLVIDANGFGQNASSVLNNGAALLAADPQKNLLFSVHMYDVYETSAGGRAKITSTLQSAVTAQLPLLVGEFGWQAGNPVMAIDAPFIMSECIRLKLGFLGWSWKGNAQALSGSRPRLGGGAAEQLGQHVDQGRGGPDDQRHQGDDLHRVNQSGLTPRPDAAVDRPRVDIDAADRRQRARRRRDDQAVERRAAEIDVLRARRRAPVGVVGVIVRAGVDQLHDHRLSRLAELVVGEAVAVE